MREVRQRDCTRRAHAPLRARAQVFFRKLNWKRWERVTSLTNQHYDSNVADDHMIDLNHFASPTILHCLNVPTPAQFCILPLLLRKAVFYMIKSSLDNVKSGRA